MSEYWSIKCNICNIITEENANHLSSVLLNIMNHSNDFKRIKDSDTDGYFELGILGHGTEFIDFVIEHDGHDMIVLSEYGDYITKDGVKHKKGD